MIVRTVCPRSDGASLPRMRMRILPSLSSFIPNGGAAQPISIWPDMTWVSVPAGPPVAGGLALTPSSARKASTGVLELGALGVKAIGVLAGVVCWRLLAGTTLARHD